jgi:hypothetical protein
MTRKNSLITDEMVDAYINAIYRGDSSHFFDENGSFDHRRTIKHGLTAVFGSYDGSFLQLVPCQDCGRLSEELTPLDLDAMR